MPAGLSDGWFITHPDIVSGFDLSSAFRDIFDPIFSGTISGFKLRFSCQANLDFLKVKKRFYVARFGG
jgi:hypothetical protein